MIPEGMQRRTIDLPIEHIEALDSAAGQDGVSTSTRVAALVQLWVSDEECRQKVAGLAREISVGKLQRKRGAAAIAQQHRWPAKDDSPG